MYMQTDPPALPKNYSGSAFSPDGERRFPTPPPEPAPEPPPSKPSPLHDPPEQVSDPTAEAFAPKSAENHPVGGLISRFPFLSSLLPPRRARERSPLPDWVLLGAVALLFFSDGENDILPLLLLLLLWD